MTIVRLRRVSATYDERFGRLLRLIRGRAGMTQKDLAKVSGVPLHDVWLVEGGRGREVRLDRIRRLFEAVGGQARLNAWWNGAAADRLLDEKHAQIGEKAAALYLRRGWQTALEVTFNEYGDRGSVDLLAGLRSAGAISVNEIKSEFGSLEETNRSLDVKERMAPKIAQARFGWRSTVVGRILILPNESVVRRVVAAHAATMTAMYPARSREIRAWLHRPDRPIRGIWFVSNQQHAKAEWAREPQVAPDQRESTHPAQSTGQPPKLSSYFADLTQGE